MRQVTDMQETQFGGTGVTKQKRVIHFTSGETLQQQDSDEEEEEEEPTFRERTKLSFKNLARLVGRMSLFTCDFLGERLAGALGLKDAKYQYAIDQHRRAHKTTSRTATDGLMEEETGTTPLSREENPGHYGATEQTCPADTKTLYEKTQTDRGRHNKGYQEDKDCLE